MRRGFTVLELIVASLLLGVLVTVMTMVINQSSVVWRVGIAGVEQMDDARDNIAELREEADNAYLWDSGVRRLLSPWTPDGALRERAIDVSGVTVENYEKAAFLNGKLTEGMPIADIPLVPVGSSKTSGYKSYVINVISAGPDGEVGTWDDIQSIPDDYEL